MYIGDLDLARLGDYEPFMYMIYIHLRIIEM